MEYLAYPDTVGNVYGVGLGAMAGVMTVVYAVMFLFGIAMYIMQAIAFMKMAKKTGVRHGWLSFIPVGNIYIIGRIADAGKGKRTNTKRLMGSFIAFLIIYVLFIVLLVAAIISAPMADTLPSAFIAPMIIMVLAIFAIAICLAVFEYIAYYHISTNFGGEGGVAYFIGILLGMFLMPIVSVILFLILSGKTPALSDEPQIITATATETDSVF